jgi:L-histidine Nalpha-methyltransferase
MRGVGSQSEKLRLSFVDLGAASRAEDFGESVREGFLQSPKSLPARFFYDARGSELFEKITELPEYYLTRCEEEILKQHARVIITSAGWPESIVEFGSGSSAKTRYLLRAATVDRAIEYTPVDISKDFLRTSAEALLSEFSGLSIVALAGEYYEAIENLADGADHPRLFLFLGSNIGNFEPPEAIRFLSAIRNKMGPQDRLLLGVDLAKPAKVIEPAYNDSQGVTAAFNKNILRRINGELRANFDLSAFEHSAPYLADRMRVEMRLVITRDAGVHVAHLNESYRFFKGEYIHTENSYKYTGEALEGLISASGLLPADEWRDENGWFSVLLLEPNDRP